MKQHLRDPGRQGSGTPDLVIVATDANCKGLDARRKELHQPDAPTPMIPAIPDPHIERRLLPDGAAFKSVFGKGCDAPDMKCSRDRSKQRLVEAIHATNVMPALGGIEFAAAIVREMDIDRAARSDRSFERFVGEARRTFRMWSKSPTERFHGLP